jgi:hypothetical protein
MMAMRCGLLLMLMSATAIAAPTTGPTVKGVIAEYDARMTEFNRAYQAAKTRTEREKLVEEKYPKADEFATRLLKLARTQPASPEARDAATWVVLHGRSADDRDAAMDILMFFTRDPQLKQIVEPLSRCYNVKTQPLLEKLIAEAPDRNTKGVAQYILGVWLKERAELARNVGQISGQWATFLGQATIDEVKKRSPQEYQAGAEAALLEAQNKYGDVPYGRETIADHTRAHLFEMKNLVIGKVAPEIEGPTVDGKHMKLSDFRGKVVVLDFFGDW